MRWIETLHAKSRSEGYIREQELYSVEEVRELVALPAETLIEKRDRAAIAFLFLSGMRNAAFCSLPLEAVLVHKGTGMVRQWPHLGVRTKWRKTANTWLLPIPDLKEIVVEWDSFLRKILPGSGLWFPHIPYGEIIKMAPGKNRSFNSRLASLCKRGGMPYRSVHALRHGHTVWAVEGCTVHADLKAVSTNMMHASLEITDRIYAKLSGLDVQQRIAGLKRKPAFGVGAD